MEMMLLDKKKASLQLIFNLISFNPRKLELFKVVGESLKGYLKTVANNEIQWDAW